MNCERCGHPLAWHDEYGHCRPQVQIDASQSRGVLVETRCSYECVIPVDPPPDGPWVGQVER